MRKRLALGILSLTLVLSVAAACAEKAAKPAGVPEVITWSSLEVGSRGHMQSSIIIDAIAENTGVKIRLVPVASEIGKHTLLRAEEVQVADVGFGAYSAEEGLDEFGEMAWGPTPIQSLRIGQHPGFTLAVRGDSDIYTLADLRGKRVGVVPGLAAVGRVIEAHLAFAGLSLDDVEVIELPGFMAGIAAIAEGKIDAYPVNLSGSYAYEWEAQPWGIRYLELPASDTAGWARIAEVSPVYGPLLATRGPGITAENPIETISYGYPHIITYSWLDEDTAYFITKAMNEAYPIYAAKDESLAEYFSLEAHWGRFQYAINPLHPGAIRYYKEIGAWTSEREAIQQEQLKRQTALRALWEKTVDEAAFLKVKASEFPAFWLQKRAAAGY